MSLGLYIHVPFCSTDCSYCHFARSARHDADLRRRYAAGVATEFELRRRACDLLCRGRRPIDTVYVGGGTPSCLEPDLLGEILAGTVGRLPVTPDLELTVEANPETLTETVAAAWCDLGVTRISLGIQSLDQGILDVLGRVCRPDTARRALELACTRFPRVAADWILGPELEREALLEELSWAVGLGVEHISLYILEIHPGTEIAARVDAGRLTLPAPEDVEALYLAAVAHLEALGIRQYEVANFARPGCESRHNGRYWRRRPFLGLGPGAHGHWGRRRYANLAEVERWLAAVERGNLPVEAVDELDLTARRLERVILGLRTTAGVPVTWLPPAALDLARGQAEGLWRIADGTLALTPRGFLHIDMIEDLVARAGC